MPAVPRGEGSARHSHLTRVGRGEHAVALLRDMCSALAASDSALVRPLGRERARRKPARQPEADADVGVGGSVADQPGKLTMDHAMGSWSVRDSGAARRPGPKKLPVR
jgi:hypothetical protein